LTAATWWLLPLVAATAYLCWLAKHAFSPTQNLNRRFTPLPDERPEWATDPRLAIYPHAAQHAEQRAPLLTYLWEAEATNPNGWPTEY